MAVQLHDGGSGGGGGDHTLTPSRDSTMQTRSLSSLQQQQQQQLKPPPLYSLPFLSPPPWQQEPDQTEALRTLVQALQDSMMVIDTVAQLPKKTPEQEEEEGEWNQVMTKGAILSPAETSLEEEEQQQAQAIAETPLDERNFKSRVLQGRLVRLMKLNRVTQAMALFRESVADNLDVDANVLEDLFWFLMDDTPSNVLRGFEVFLRHCHCTRDRESPGGEGKAMMARIIAAIPLSKEVSKIKKKRMVDRLHDVLLRMDRSHQQELFPKLLLAVVQQQAYHVGTTARPIYRTILEHDIELSPAQWEAILAKTRYSRLESCLPFAEILSRLVVQDGHAVQPEIATRTLQNLAPFLDVEATTQAVHAILELSKKDSPHTIAMVDYGTLEAISSSAARTGSTELGLAVWELLEQMGYEASEAIYENMIQTFAMSYRQDQYLFACLAEMEARGYKPHRALIRGVSRSLRFSVKRIDHAYRLITEEEGPQMSVASMNTILSACGELGEVDRAFATLDEMERFGMDPDQDSYSYAMESLANELKQRQKQQQQQPPWDETKKASRLEAAEALLDCMENQGLSVSQHVFHQYINLLTTVDEVELATQCIQDALGSGLEVANLTIKIVVDSQIEQGNFDVALELAEKTTEPFDFLFDRIRKGRQKELSKAATRRRRESAEPLESDPLVDTE